MDRPEYRCLLISDFTIQTFAGYLENDRELPGIKSIIAPYDQIHQVFANKYLPCRQKKPEIAVVWGQPEKASESFHHLTHYKPTSIEDTLKEVDHYSSQIVSLSNRVKHIFVPAWVCPACHRGYGMLDMRKGGLAYTLMHMNLRLSENLSKISNIYLLDTQKWVIQAGEKAFSSKLWYMSKIPFGNEVFKEAVQDIKSALRGTMGNARKLIILDLDDTLWGGVVGEVGWKNLKLGGHDPVGEAFADFQQAVKSYLNRGIVLGIVSKNEERIALEAMENHPEMVLKREDFAGWRINRQDKAQNILELCKELNLGLQSTVFIDDNPVERYRVQSALPEVLVPEWPKNKMLYKSTLHRLRCFDTPSTSTEDLNRKNIYSAERKRRESQKMLVSPDDWLKSLEMVLKVENFNDTNLQRTHQLFNKTNQMNLSTRRMTEPELLTWVEENNHHLWTLRVSDKFGDSGLTGIISLEVEGKKGRIADFILSCRVMGRQIEETMLHILIEYSKIKGIEKICAKYLPTPKNKPCLDFFQRSGFHYDSKTNLFIWNTRDNYPFPKHILISK